MDAMTSKGAASDLPEDAFARMAAQASGAADFLKALAHESRLMILCILADGEKSVGDLERMLNLRQPAVSQQLARLRTDGLVATRRDGKIVYYSLASEQARLVIGAVHKAFCMAATEPAGEV